MRWVEFLAAAPTLAAMIEARLRKDGFAFLATLRRDGSPRISPIETTFVGTELVLGMPHGSTKAQDLKRDSRCALHAPVATKNNVDGDFKLACGTEEILDEALFAQLADKAEKAFGTRPAFRSAYCVSVQVKSASYIDSPGGVAMVWTPIEGLREIPTAQVGG